MMIAALVMTSIQQKNWSTEFTRFIQPMAVGFVSYGAYMISLETIHTKTGLLILIVAAIASYLVQTPFVFPVILIGAGLVTALKYKSQAKEQKQKIVVPWANFMLWIGVLIFAAVLGAATKSLPVKLFENFYRNGSLVFGGGQVLAPLLYTEFVEIEPDDKQELNKVSKLKAKIKEKYAPKPLHHPTSHDEF